MFHTGAECRLTFMNCSMCAVEHFRFRDHAHTKPASYCCACHAKKMRASRPKHSELSKEQKIKAAARAQANVYQRRGTLKVKPCFICGAMAQKHHEDYSKPLEVLWVCVKHHIELHRKEKPA